MKSRLKKIYAGKSKVQGRGLFVVEDIKKEETIAFNKKNVDIGLSKNGYGYSYFAKKLFKPGDKLMMSFGKIVDHQTAHISVQIGYHKHYLPSRWNGRYWNHSCLPNTYIKTQSSGFPALIALKKINPGDEITFHYSMTEFLWAKKADENYLKCLCDQKKCSGKILSFTQLSPREQVVMQKKGICSEYLLKDNSLKFLKRNK